ncbi:NAD(P)-dependent dehydrogenase (short-subunit alcohol dehydrogenase family) [Paraburkholderia sp. WC7.3d]
MQVALAARDTSKLADLVDETGALAVSCDAGRPDEVTALFDRVENAFGAPDLVVYNASGRYRAAVEAIDPQKLEDAIRVTALGGFLIAQAAAVRMVTRGSGTILLTGATASVKGLPGSTPFAMGKFALRGMAQCMARELAPRNIHVAHFVIDGGIASSRVQPDGGNTDDKWLEPDVIAKEYLHIHRQHRSAWTWEVELRPWVERF